MTSVWHSCAGFEKECQDFLLMIQQDGDSNPLKTSILDSFGSSDLSNSTHSSLLGFSDLSAGEIAGVLGLSFIEYICSL